MISKKIPTIKGRPFSLLINNFLDLETDNITQIYLNITLNR